MPTHHVLFERLLSKGRRSRDLTRHETRELVRLGLEHTRGNYKLLVTTFNMPPEDYKTFSTSSASISVTCRSNGAGRRRRNHTAREFRGHGRDEERTNPSTVPSEPGKWRPKVAVTATTDEVLRGWRQHLAEIASFAGFF